MRVEGIQGAYVPPRRRRSSEGVLGVEGVKAWPDLVKRDFQPAGPNELWCSDLKQIPTGEGVLHLASVLDCFSRRIVGWAMSPVADAPLVARALEMAVARRRPGEGLIHHADRGCLGSTPLSPSAPRAVPTGSHSPTAARAARTTTPPRKASSPRWKRSGSGIGRSPPTSRLAARSSSTSRSSTTAVACTPRSATGRLRRPNATITSNSSPSPEPTSALGGGGLPAARSARVRSSARPSGLAPQRTRAPPNRPPPPLACLLSDRSPRVTNVN